MAEVGGGRKAGLPKGRPGLPRGRPGLPKGRPGLLKGRPKVPNRGSGCVGTVSISGSSLPWSGV